MPIESFQYFIILFRVNQVFTFYHFITSHIYIININIFNKSKIAIFYLANYEGLSRKWRIDQAEEISERDTEAEKTMQDWRAGALKELDNWHAKQNEVAIC